MDGTDPRHGPPPAGGDPGPDRFDAEIGFRGIVLFGLALAIVAIVVHVLMWVMLKDLASREAAADPPPAPLAAADGSRMPPEPRLQIDPPGDYRTFRDAETRRLSEYGWSDREAGLARIPIERAMEIVAERGLPETGPMPPPAPEGEK